ncbi:unnamed protein product [Polarella glacialis]|uniref:Cyclic nucleotide-binding domain-containing protein n=1 Tax=Polarella glacialis TaxID=89957 RepID=A0A813IKB3_POLGL|nr:unnamed protein product [Polarella glacialis]
MPVALHRRWDERARWWLRDVCNAGRSGTAPARPTSASVRRPQMVKEEVPPAKPSGERRKRPGSAPSALASPGILSANGDQIVPTSAKGSSKVRPASASSKETIASETVQPNQATAAGSSTTASSGLATGSKGSGQSGSREGPVDSHQGGQPPSAPNPVRAAPARKGAAWAVPRLGVAAAREPPDEPPKTLPMQAWPVACQSKDTSGDRRDSTVRTAKPKKDAYKAGVRSTFPAARAEYVLSKTPFFKEFDGIMPGVLNVLAQVAQRQSARTGELLFRQGDPPEDCYVILRGSVAVCVRSTPQESPRQMETEEEKEERLEAAEKSKGRCWACFKTALRRYRSKVKSALGDVGGKRTRTTEGHNTYSEETMLGKQVAILSSTAFGELGLMESRPRAASIVCLEACEFLVIDRENFVKNFASSVTSDMYSKRTWMHKNVPGFDAQLELRAQVAGMRTHPAELFRERADTLGTAHLVEGTVAAASVFVIKEGEVEFLHRGIPKSWGGDGPEAAAVREVSFATMGPGTLFCSLGFFGLPALEQFTVRSKTARTVIYVATGEDLRDLDSEVKKEVQQHIKVHMRPLLSYSPAFVNLDVLRDKRMPPGRRRQGLLR